MELPKSYLTCDVSTIECRSRCEMLIQELKRLTKMETNFFIKMYVIKFNVFITVVIDE